MNINITDFEANTTLDEQAMNSLGGGCCYFHAPVCCIQRPVSPWLKGCYRPSVIVKRAVPVCGLRRPKRWVNFC